MKSLVAIVIILILVFMYYNRRENIVVKILDRLPSVISFPSYVMYNGLPELKPVDAYKQETGTSDLVAGPWTPGFNSFPQQQMVVNYESTLPPEITPRGRIFVRLIYSECSKDHPLVALFDNLVKEYGQRAELATFAFVYDKIEDCGESLPRIVKYRSEFNDNWPNCETKAEYTKAPTYGALSDWVMNEGLLYVK